MTAALRYIGKALKPLTLACLLAGVCLAQPAPKVTVAPWPGGRSAAISLTFDDGVDSHLDNAGPILKKHGLAGTFFVATGFPAWNRRAPEWRRLAAEGNELANHTVTHPCLLERIKPRSVDYTPERMERELSEASSSILALTGSRRGLVFAYPCGNLTFGAPADQARNSVLMLRYITAHCFAARGYGAGGAAQDPDGMSVMNVTDLGITEGRTYAQLLEMANQATARGLWGVFAFHGIGGDWLSTPSDAFEQLAEWLESHTDTVWTATFGDVVRYIQERKALGIDQSGNTLALAWPLDRQIYDVPLTLRLDAAAGAPAPKVLVDGKPVRVKTAAGAALFDVPAGARKVVIE